MSIHRAREMPAHGGWRAVLACGQRPSAGMAGAANLFFVPCLPCHQVVDGPHTVPDTILCQILTELQQDLTGHRMLINRFDFGKVDLWIQVLSVFTCPMRP